MDESKIINFLIDLGLDEFESKIYLVLARKGILSTLQISKETGIDRSKVYRRIEDLSRKGIIEEVIDQKTKKAKAVNVDRLEILLERNEEKVKSMKQLFPSVASALGKEYGMNQPGTKVLFYRGKEGIKQMIWHVLNANKLVAGYTYRTLADLTGIKYAEKWIREFVKRNLMVRDIFSDDLIESKQKFKEKFVWNTRNFISKYIPPEIITIDHQIDIYNDVVSFYNWHEGEVFGVEIHNEKVARMQKQIFEVLWKIGEDPIAAEQKFDRNHDRKISSSNKKNPEGR